MAMSQTVNDTTATVGTTTTAFGLSYAITSIFSALLVVLKEMSVGVHDALAAVTGHHWITHGVLNIIIFVVLGLVLSRSASSQMTTSSLITTIIGSTVISGLIIAGFFGLAG